MFKKQLPFLVTLLTVITLVACKTQNNEADLPYTHTEFLLGSYATISIYTPDKEAVLEQVFDRISELESILTVNDPSLNSQVEQINRQAGVEPVQVSDEIFNFIQKALAYTKESNGIFNVTIGPLTKLWDINFENERRPEQSEINEILPLLNYELVTLDEDHKTVYLEEEGMRFDFGGIAKGYVADEVVKTLKENGVESAIIDLSGDVFTLGQSLRSNNWLVGIQNPYAARGNTIGTIPVTDQAVFTSGVYERYFEEDGQTYHHILNSETGFPFDNGVTSLTIVSDEGFNADAYSTIAFGKGIEAGLAYIETIAGVEAMFINDDKEIFLTSGLKEIFTLQDSEFTLID